LAVWVTMIKSAHTPDDPRLFRIGSMAAGSDSIPNLGNRRAVTSKRGADNTVI
jgi:hypothetical protein